jgi:flagellar assembly protein FliH
MQSLFKIIKSPVTSGSEIISLPDIKLIHEKREQKKNDLIPNNSSEIYDEILFKANRNAETIVKKAETVVKDAENTAKKLLDDTKITADNMMNEAKEEGYQQGYKQGYNEGYKYGIDEASNEAALIRKNADIYLESCRTETEAYIKKKHQEILQLSLTIAKQVIKSEVMINPDIVSKICENVLAQATDRTHVILKVNPADFNVVKNKKDDLSIYVESPNNLFIIADSSVTQGSVKAETSSGFIDGDIETQLDLIAKILLRN